MIQTNNQQKSINTKYWQQHAQNPIVRGYFPRYKSYKEMSIAKLNKFLSILLFLACAVSFISYYFVTINEVVLDKVGREITETRTQNLELQNKLDNLKSYYNVDKTVKQKNLLQKPQKVVEVSSIKADETITNKSIRDVAPKTSENFNWAVGF